MTFLNNFLVDMRDREEWWRGGAGFTYKYRGPPSWSTHFPAAPATPSSVSIAAGSRRDSERVSASSRWHLESLWNAPCFFSGSASDLSLPFPLRFRILRSPVIPGSEISSVGEILGAISSSDARHRAIFYFSGSVFCFNLLPEWLVSGPKSDRRQKMSNARGIIDHRWP